MKTNNRSLPKIVIVGRPNVGKSTLFNRVIRKRKAIVEKAEATTRDRISEIVIYCGYTFELVDTGGVEFNNKKDLFRQVERQVIEAVKQADVVLFVCDAKDGVMPLDQRIGYLLRSFNKKIILVINKADNKNLLQNSLEFYSLGFGEPVAVSSIHGSGVGDLLDVVYLDLTKMGKAEPCPDSGNGQGPALPVKLSVVGRPNSGKSSLINTILGEERVIVSPEPGTTRDSVDTYFEKNGKRFILIDTAGIRSKGKIKDEVTYFSIVRTENSIKRSDAILVLLDGVLGVTKEDYRIIDLVQSYMKPFVLAVNKWDLCLEKGLRVKDYELAIRGSLKFIYNAPVLFISALTGTNVEKVLDSLCALTEKTRKNFSTSRLNDILRQIKIKSTRLYSIRQAKNSLPEFDILVKKPTAINESDRRCVINILRSELNLGGVPIKINFRKKQFRA